MELHYAGFNIERENQCIRFWWDHAAVLRMYSAEIATLMVGDTGIEPVTSSV